jgi:hypothetical protein
MALSEPTNKASITRGGMGLAIALQLPAQDGVYVELNLLVG